MPVANTITPIGTASAALNPSDPYLREAHQDGVGDSLRIQRFLGRNGYPVRVLELDRPGDEGSEAQAVLAAHGLGLDDLLVVLCGADRVLSNPGNAELGACQDITEPAEAGVVYGERQMQRFKSARFLSTHSRIHNHFQLHRHYQTANQHRSARGDAFRTWREVVGVASAA